MWILLLIFYSFSYGSDAVIFGLFTLNKMCFTKLVSIEHWHKLNANYTRLSFRGSAPRQLCEAIYDSVKMEVIYSSCKMIKMNQVIFYLQKNFSFFPWACWWADHLETQPFFLVWFCCTSTLNTCTPAVLWASRAWSWAIMQSSVLMLVPHLGPTADGLLKDLSALELCCADQAKRIGYQ